MARRGSLVVGSWSWWEDRYGFTKFFRKFFSKKWHKLEGAYTQRLNNPYLAQTMISSSWFKHDSPFNPWNMWITQALRRLPLQCFLAPQSKHRKTTYTHIQYNNIVNSCTGSCADFRGFQVLARWSSITLVQISSATLLLHPILALTAQEGYMQSYTIMCRISTWTWLFCYILLHFCCFR